MLAREGALEVTLSVLSLEAPMLRPRESDLSKAAQLELKSALSFQNDQSLHETNTNLGRRLRWLHSQPSPISV